MARMLAEWPRAHHRPAVPSGSTPGRSLASAGVPIAADPPVFTYTVLPMPPSVVGRRWRWQLFLGERLLAGGWQLGGERRALRALSIAATRAAHELAGVRVLRPERAEIEGKFVPGARVRVGSGAFACVLAPREDDVGAATAA